ncbi:MAG: zeta toxin family protein [Capnocytophaga sp.]|nr:zeta toxin family protein [Capnocytophaga sp.]
MDLHKVEEIYQEKREKILRNLTPQEKPLAFILGGQPASGKSKLAKEFMGKFSSSNILFVNGDIYREFHPNRQELINNPLLYSRETQIFSNVFTENLIREAIKNRYNIMVEGTMRNPQVPYNTAKMFKENGYEVEVLAISAPPIFTELGLYNRYQEEINFQGWGRLAEIDSHNSAVNGILASLDLLYNEKVVDKIHLYSYQAEKHIVSFSLKNNKWDIEVLPSNYIVDARDIQLQKKENITKLIEQGENTLNQISDDLKPKVNKILVELRNISQENNMKKRV